MTFELWRSWGSVALLPPEAAEYFLLVVYMVATVALLIRSRQDFFRLFWRRLPLFFALLAASIFVNNLLVVELAIPNPLPPPNIPANPPAPFAPLLGMIPVIAASAWLGPGPAMMIGLVTGFLRARHVLSGILDPWIFAALGYGVGFLLRQDYRGRLWSLLRQPLAAGSLAVVLVFPLRVVSILAHTLNAWLAGLDYARTILGYWFLALLLEMLVAALILQVIYLLVPRSRPVRSARRFPPHTRTLNLRLLFLLVPLIFTMTCVLVSAVTLTTLQVATSTAVDEIARDANSAAEDIPFFIHTGQGLLAEFANDERLWVTDPITLEQRLSSDIRTVAFFDQLVLFDTQANRLAMYPPPPTGDPVLTDEETELLQRVIDNGAPQISSVHRSTRDEIILTFFAPVERGEDEAAPERLGALLGRTRVDINPIMNRVLASLQWARARGEGFVVDAQGRIILHSDPDMMLTNWSLPTDRSPISTLGPLPGAAYESSNRADNTRELVYHLPVDGYTWAMVIRLPYEVVLQQATRIATPLLLFQVLFGGGLLVFIPLFTSWMTRPLTQLATAADRIAEGDLSNPVRVPGNDEVARVGEAFDGMRIRLKDRLEDLSLLLQVSQAVSATLELPKGMPYILEGVLKATQARVARMVLLSADGEPQMAMGRGEPREGLSTLDRALTLAARDQEQPLVIENLSRASTLADPKALSGPIQAVIALPVRTKERVSAVMWVGYGESRQIDLSEVDLLSTLASQTAVLVENARLFQAAEGGRRRLAAILASTTDAVLVTDRDDRILLLNPAAERAFGLASERAVGQRLGETGLMPELVEIFEAPLPLEGALSEEVLLPDGRTLYASVSVILTADGERLGRVAVMRDVTHFKELDEMKSEFVATVSHDLRAPLTFMRGYTTMLPMVGALNDKQQEYVDKILHGVGQMGELIDDLLSLGRIEAGVGLERRPCHLGAILVEAVDGMRARAAAKGLTLSLEPAQQVAVVSGDAVLLRRVVTNLVDNAVKYTPSGGRVSVALSVQDEQALIHVSDTGIGIDPEDQVRLFEKFYRVKRRDTADIPGTGLGLAIVKSIVERHGGKVWLDSEPGQGSTFHVSLPLDEEHSPRAGKRPTVLGE